MTILCFVLFILSQETQLMEHNQQDKKDMG